MAKGRSYRKEDIWLKAAIAGGLWASLEIIAGSFLHNLRIPFAGSILATAGVVLLIGFHNIWPYKGLIIRSGIICALMKSISPSAVILGPMTGILLEALMLEAAIRIIPFRNAAYLTGGVLSVGSALLHKIISLLILYGSNIIVIYINLIEFAFRQVKIEGISPLEILLILSAFYIVAGIGAAALGIKTGNRSCKEFTEINNRKREGNSNFEIFRLEHKRKYSSLLLIIHIISISGGLLLVNTRHYLLGNIFIIFYILFCILYYGNLIKRLSKPIFWVQLAIIVILAALFSGGIPNKETFTIPQGLFLGLEMILRAILIIVGFSSVSIEIRNPLVKMFLYRRGFKKFYEAVGLAFGILPQLLKLMPRPVYIARHPVNSLSMLLCEAKRWEASLKQKAENIFIDP